MGKYHTKDDEIECLRAELADMREIAENWEIKAKQTDIKLAAWQHNYLYLRSLLGVDRQDGETDLALWQRTEMALRKIIYDDLVDARQDVERMRAALEPFAKLASRYDYSDQRVQEHAIVQIESLREARTAFQGAGHELVATRQDVERMQEAILSMIPSLDRLITDYQCVPDASDGDGQSVFDDARTALAKARAALQGATGTPKPEK